MRHRTALVALALSLTGCVSRPPLAERAPSPATFDQVVTLVETRFYAPTRLRDAWAASVVRHRRQWQRARTREEREKVLRDLLAGLGASHTGLYLPGEPAWYELLDLYREGPTREAVPRLFQGGVVRYETLGLVLTEARGRSYVADVLDGSPAAAAGVRAGERLVADARLEVDGGPRGTGPRRRVVRMLVADGDDERVVDAEPVRIQPEELYLAAQRASARVVERGGRRVAYVHLRSWASERFQELLEEQLREGPLAGADALVLDLRGGWGGANPEYIELFDPHVPQVELIPRGGTVPHTPRQPPLQDRRALHDSAAAGAEACAMAPYRWMRPVVLLVDGTTRSGKEVLARAFQRNHVGPVVGERTAGAVLGGTPFVLADGTLLLLAVTDVRADGERLEGVGVEPDIEVPRDLIGDPGRDPQLDAALDEAARLAALPGDRPPGQG